MRTLIAAAAAAAAPCAVATAGMMCLLAQSTIWKLTASGQHIWQRTIAASGSNPRAIPHGLAVDQETGAIYMVGMCQENVDFDPSRSGENIIYCNTWQSTLGFVMKLNARGRLQWVRTTTSCKWISVLYHVDIAPSGGIVTAGTFERCIDLPAPGQTETGVSGQEDFHMTTRKGDDCCGSRDGYDSDFFLWGLDALGRSTFAQQVSSPGPDYLSAVTTADNGICAAGIIDNGQINEIMQGNNNCTLSLEDALDGPSNRFVAFRVEPPALAE